MIFEQSYVIFHENLFIESKLLHKEFKWKTLPMIEKFLKYDGVKDGIVYMIYCNKYDKLIQEVLDKYNINFEIIHSEEEAKEVAKIEDNVYFKYIEDTTHNITLNPILISSLEDALRYIIRHRL